MGVVVWNTACVVLLAVAMVSLCVQIVAWVPKHVVPVVEDDALLDDDTVAGDGLSGVRPGLWYRIFASKAFVSVIVVVEGLVEASGPEEVAWSAAHARTMFVTGLVAGGVLWATLVGAWARVPRWVRQQSGLGRSWIVLWTVVLILGYLTLFAGFHLSHWWWVQGHS
jgi:hypothetical protein